MDSRQGGIITALASSPRTSDTFCDLQKQFLKPPTQVGASNSLFEQSSVGPDRWHARAEIDPKAITVGAIAHQSMTADRATLRRKAESSPALGEEAGNHLDASLEQSLNIKSKTCDDFLTILKHLLRR